MSTQFSSLRKQANNILAIHDSASLDDLSHSDKMIKELLLQQIELEIQNANLIEMQNKLEESNHRYAELYDLAPVAYFTINVKGVITEVNTAGAELLGMPKEKLINRSLSRYMSSESHPAYYGFRKLAKNDTDLHQIEVQLKKGNGEIFFAELKGKLIVNDTTQEFLIMMTDISHYKQPASNHEPFKLDQSFSEISKYIDSGVNRLQCGQYEINKLMEIIQSAITQLNEASEVMLKLNDGST